MTKTLVAEDDRDIADLLATILTREGHDVSVASDGVQALLLLQSEHFDLVVMDHGLPRLTGLEVVEMATALPGGPSFIIVTGHPWLRLTRDHRVERYVTKPFDSRQFLGIVQDVLQGPVLELSSCP